MNKAIVVLFFILDSSFYVLPFSCKAQLADTVYHQFTFGGSNDDYARKIISTSDSGYLVVGTTASFGTNSSDIYVIKIDSLGNKEWSQIYGTLAIEWGYSARQTPDSGYIIVGFANQNSNYDIHLLKINSLGSWQWEKNLGGSDWDFGYDIELTPDSGFIICGKSYSFSNGGSDVYLVKCDSTGNILWQNNYGGNADESANTIIRDRNSDYLIVGETQSFGAGDDDIYVLKIKGNGDTLWTKTYGGIRFDAGYGVDTTIDGAYSIVSTTYSFPDDTTGSNIYFLKIDTIGNIIWSKLIVGKQDEEGRFVKQLHNGEFLTGGMTQSYGGGGKDFFIQHFDSAGNYEGPTIGGLQDEEAYSAAIGKDKKMFFAGITNSFGCGFNDVFLIRKDTISFGASNLVYKNTLCDTPTVNIFEISNEALIFIYPNPAHDYIRIESNIFNQNQNSRNCSLRINDVTGREIKSIKVSSFPVLMDRKNMSSGIYFINLNVDNRLYRTEKLILY